MPDQSKCRSCGAPIFWATMAKTGKPNPLDALAVPDGNVATKWEGKTIGEVLTGDELQRCRDLGVPLYISHFATCPNAKQHRKPKEST